MTTITYLGDGTVEWFGRPFRPNVAVDVDDMGLLASERERLLGKARTNPFFEVGGEPMAAREPEQDDDGQEEDLDGYKIEPTGQGWYRIVDPDGNEVAKGLRKPAAEARVIDLAAGRT